MQPKNRDPRLLEEEACLYLKNCDFNRAFNLFKEAANIYKAQNKHKEAAICFASAGSCYNIKIGEKTFYNSAEAYKSAAYESIKALDFEYASLLYRYAAICYERDGDFINFSDCFYMSKDSFRKFLFYSLFKNRLKNINYIRFILLWLGYTLSFLVWGYGERPFRTFLCIIFVLFLFSILYCFGSVFYGGKILRPNFFEAFYLSIITITTVGYGDLVPVGINKIIAGIEAFCGIIFVPIFIVSLSRRYLRI